MAHLRLFSQLCDTNTASTLPQLERDSDWTLTAGWGPATGSIGKQGDSRMEHAYTHRTLRLWVRAGDRVELD